MRAAPADDVGMDLALAFASADEKVPEVEMKRMEEGGGAGRPVDALKPVERAPPLSPSVPSGTLPATAAATTEDETHPRPLMARDRTRSSTTNGSVGSDVSREEERVLALGPLRDESLRPVSNPTEGEEQRSLAARLKESLGLGRVRRLGQRQRRRRQKLRRGTHASEGSADERVANAAAGAGAAVSRVDCALRQPGLIVLRERDGGWGEVLLLLLLCL